MDFIMKRLFLLFYIGLACMTLSSSPLIGETIEVRGLAIGDKNSSKTEKYLQTQGGYQLLPFLNQQPSRSIKAYSGESLLLYEKVTTEGELPTYQIAEKVNLPKAAKSVLILTLDANGEESYLAVNDEFLEASYDKWLIINTTSKSVNFRVGADEKPFSIDANDGQICRIKSASSGSASALGQAKWNGNMKTFYSTYWPIREGERSIVIFIEQGNRIRVKKISDALLKK